VRGVFVTGTDTGVGKTAVSAALMVRYRGARYWKPIQTGPEDDTAEVLRLSSSPREAAYFHGARLRDPVSPHLAARHAGTRIDLPFLTADLKESAGPWIVEGAGGALVPVNESDLMVHLMERLGLPVVVVARTTLGTINHTLLTIEAVRARRLHVAGVVMVGEPDADNRAAIAEYGNVAMLGEMPWFGEGAGHRPARHLEVQPLAAWAAAQLDPENLLAEFLA
jgi:malonyl-CoA O-methyltransferase